MGPTGNLFLLATVTLPPASAQSGWAPGTLAVPISRGGRGLWLWFPRMLARSHDSWPSKAPTPLLPQMWSRCVHVAQGLDTGGCHLLKASAARLAAGALPSPARAPSTAPSDIALPSTCMPGLYAQSNSLPSDAHHNSSYPLLGDSPFQQLSGPPVSLFPPKSLF